MNRILLTLLTLSALIFSTGCSVTPKYRVTIDAITADKAPISPTSYAIKALDKNKSSESLIFKRHSTKLAEILEQKGYIPATAEVKQTIYFDYGLEKLNEATETYSEPNFSIHVGYGGYYDPFYDPFYGGGIFGGGYRTYSQTHSYYNRYITLLAKDQFNKELWRVDVSSVGESKNLRKIIPLLIEASAPYLGTNTDEPIKLVIKDTPQKEVK